MTKDKRVFHRIRVPTNTSLVFKDQAYPVQLKNISLQGATVVTEEDINLVKGNSCKLRINPEGSDISMDLDALAMYQRKNRIGFQFSENSPGTVQKLHHLISDNFENTEM